MSSEILSFYKGLLKIKEFQGMPSNWQLVNPYIKHQDKFEFFIKKYYQDRNSRDLIIALNPGRYGCNNTGIALTDENVLFTKLNCPNKKESPEKEGTATKIYSIIEELHPNFNTFFSKFFMTNIFPFGVVADGKNVVFNKIMQVPSIKKFSRNFISKSIELFKPKRIFCMGRGSESFIQKHFPETSPVYLHHPAYTFPEKEKNKYRSNLR